jgi:uncharacterized membrane protein YeiB
VDECAVHRFGQRATAAVIPSRMKFRSGVFAGPGYVALFGLISLRVTHGRVVGALAALGQRSLSGYLLQSVAWLVLLAPFTLALAGKFLTPSFAGAVIAVAVWFTTVVLADLLNRKACPARRRRCSGGSPTGAKSS